MAAIVTGAPSTIVIQCDTPPCIVEIKISQPGHSGWQLTSKDGKLSPRSFGVFDRSPFQVANCTFNSACLVVLHILYPLFVPLLEKWLC